ncbi:MAG: nuclear transport factor 2 family protein [Acidimicrobiales bacterium]
MANDVEDRARVAIDHVLFTIAERRDAGDFEGMAALFARSSFDTDYPDAPSGHGVQQGAGEIAEGFRAMCHIYEQGGARTQYHTTNSIYDIDADSGRADVRSYYYVTQAVPAHLDHVGGVGFGLQIVSSGHYADRFARIDGQWQIVARKIFADLTGDRSRHMTMDPVEYGRQFRQRKAD